MPKRTKIAGEVKRQLAGLSPAERALLRRAVYEHPNAIRLDKAESLMADGLSRLGLLRAVDIGERFAWRLDGSAVMRRSALREALFPF